MTKRYYLIEVETSAPPHQAHKLDERVGQALHFGLRPGCRVWRVAAHAKIAEFAGPPIIFEPDPELRT